MITRRQALKGLGATLVTGPLVRFPTATAQQPRVRRDVTRMDVSDPFFSQYADAIQKMHELPDTDPRNWRRQAIIHADHCVHNAVGFLEWHRFYITSFERICGELIDDPDFALPYWDWTNDGGLLPEPFFGDNPLNVTFLNDPSNYNTPRWDDGRIVTVGSRWLSATRGLQDDDRFSRLVTDQYIDNIRKMTDYNTFRVMLEGSPHGAVHLIIGAAVNGHMRSGLSPLDPVFWLHHCNVDRIWAEWQAAGNPTAPNPTVYSGHFYDHTGRSVTVEANQSHDHHFAMGFTYDSITAPRLTLLELEDIPEESIADRWLGQSAEAAAGDSLIGQLENRDSSLVDVATNLRVPTPNLVSELSGSRIFRATSLLESPRAAIEPNRFVAEFRGVSSPAPERGPIIVNVFLGVPLPDTTDPKH